MNDTNKDFIQTEVIRLVDLPTRYEKNIPFDLITIVNYRKNPELSHLAELGDSIENNGLLQPVGLIETDGNGYRLAFGQCRALACDKYTSFDTLPDAKIWPKEALRFIRSLALLENMGRKGAPIIDEIVGLREALEIEFGDYPKNKRRQAFEAQTGISQKTITMRLKIADAMDKSKEFSQIIEDKIIKDVLTLYNIAQALLMELTPKKKELLDNFISLVKAGDLSTTARETSESINKYYSGKGKKPLVKSNTEIENDKKKNTESITGHIIKENTKNITEHTNNKISPRQITNFTKKLDNIINIDSDTANAARDLINVLQNLLNKSNDESILQDTNSN